jgi:uncharacterized protein YyaL (SSP411 family)
MASDYASMMRAALALAEAGSEVDALRLCDLARGFADALEVHHRDQKTGHLCISADDARDVIFRSQPTIDDAVPNVHGLYVQALLKLASLTGELSMRNRADEIIATLLPALRSNPYGHASLLNALDQRLRNIEIVIVGKDVEGLRAAALALSFLNRTVRVAKNSAPESEFSEIAACPQDKAAAFVCTEGRCSLPATQPEEIALRLASLRH